MSKQTAVDWFFDKMKSHFEHDGDLFETVCMTYAISKAMEKEQMIQFTNNYLRQIYEVGEMTIEDFYNETYGGDE
jgi:1,2-phenylacetyl-CoA epoxidase catalytic subunit